MTKDVFCFQKEPTSAIKRMIIFELIDLELKLGCIDI